MNVTKKDRATIRQHAENCGCRYRITRTRAVHYYGKMPNSNVVGWYLQAHDAWSFAQDIREGRA